MSSVTPVRELASNTLFQPGDVFILFGELFGRGYANGLVEIARKHGMKLIGITVGRRDGGVLRPLTMGEKTEIESFWGGKIINIPLEAGFDLDPSVRGVTPAEMLKEAKPGNWEEYRLDWEEVASAQQAGKERFRKNLETSMSEVQKHIPEGANVFFAHTMAGGMPRAKIIMVIANKVFKGRGKRYVGSKTFWESDIGKLCEKNFEEVTANTFEYLIEATSEIREKVASWGKEVRYTAYGYHGTEIFVDGEYQWQTYTPYKQGYAKMKLEEFARHAWEKGIQASVYNCPEIRTSSSDIFVGVELPLFPIFKALKKEGGENWGQKYWNHCNEKLEEKTIDEVLEVIERYYADPIFRHFQNFEAWPMDNTAELAEVMIGTSEQISGFHKEKNDLISDYLSTLILEASGSLIFHHTSTPQGPVLWLGHDIIAKQLHCLYP